MAKFIQGSKDTYIFERGEVIELLIGDFPRDDAAILFLEKKLHELTNNELSVLFTEASANGSWCLEDFVNADDVEAEDDEPEIRIVNSLTKGKSKTKKK